MRLRRRAVRLGLVGLVILGAASGVDARRRKPDFRALEKTVRAELAATGTPGAAVAIVQGERVVYARGFGRASVEAPAPVTPDTLFRVGSVTKMFTAAAATSLAEAGRVKLGAPIATYVPGLSSTLGRLTLHQLLTHTSGLRDGAEPYGRREDAALGETVRSWGAERFFEEPGQVFSYANPGYNLAGFVLEQAAGKPFPDLVEERVFRPLGMTHSTFRPAVAMTYALSQGHVPGEGGKPVVVRPYTENVAEWPSGFLFSSANDLARWASASMNDGKIEGKAGLSPGQVRRLSTPYVDVQDPFSGRYGYGLMVWEDRGQRVVDHGGVHVGFASQVRMYPDRRFAVVVLGNSAAPLPKTMERAVQLGLGLKPNVVPPAAPQPVSTEEARRLAGRYGTPPEVVELVAKGEGLVLKQGELELPVSKVGGIRYSVVPTGASAPFQFVLVPGPDGRPRYFGIDFHKLKRLPDEPKLEQEMRERQ